MVETFSSCKVAQGFDNIPGLTNLETVAVNGLYFPTLEDYPHWDPGATSRRGDGSIADQGYASTYWNGPITDEMWLYLFHDILGSNREGPVTIQTRRYKRDEWIICNARMNIGKRPSMRQVNRWIPPFQATFTRLKVLEEQHMYAAIHCKDGDTAQEDITTTPVLLTGWTANGEYSGITPAYASSTLTAGYGGYHHVGFHITATKTASQKFLFNVRVNAVEAGIQCQFAADALTQASTSMGDFLDLDADDIVTVYVETDDADAGTDLTPLDMQLTLESVSLDN